MTHIDIQVNDDRLRAVAQRARDLVAPHVPPGANALVCTSELPEGELGSFVPGLFHPQRRSVITLAPQARLDTVVHELGHWIDHLLGRRLFASQEAAEGYGPLAQWHELVHSTRQIAVIRSLGACARGAAAQSDVDARVAENFSDLADLGYANLVTEHINYLLRPTELFARSFVQLVWQQAGLDEPMAASEVEQLLGQWQEPDFAAVDVQLNAVLKAAQLGADTYQASSERST
jgi:hypothetical protein